MLEPNYDSVRHRFVVGDETSQKLAVVIHSAVARRRIAKEIRAMEKFVLAVPSP
jgi:hypothetical protein